MNYYAVTYLTADGGICERVITAWHAAAAERTCALIFGGSHHTAQELSHA